jgi:hypothetical protein
MAAVLVLAMLLTGGCSMLEGEYLSTSQYTFGEEQTSDEQAGNISDYTELRRAVSAIVRRHDESAKLTFNAYDGVIADDLPLACWEVKSETALGAYTVEYMSYDLTRIVSYYEAEIYVTYRRTQEQVDSMLSLSGMSAVEDALLDAMKSRKEELVFKLNAANLTAETITQSVRRLYLSLPLSIIAEPELEVEICSGSGLEHIVQVNFDYGFASEQLDEMKAELLGRTVDLSSSVTPGGGTDTVLELAQVLRASCTLTDEDDATKNSAYGALVAGKADSEGMALGFAALCAASGIDCVVVEGRQDAQTHYWNIVTVGDVSRHIDLSVTGGEVTLQSDSQMLGSYWWDTDNYPECTETESEDAPETDETEQ